MRSLLRNSGKKDTGWEYVLNTIAKKKKIYWKNSTKVGRGTWQMIGLICNLVFSFDHLKMGEKDYR